jgi:hypothetical protein
MSGGTIALRGFDYQATVILDRLFAHFDEHGPDAMARPKGADDLYLECAFTFRGKSAHGLYIPEDEIRFRALVTAISALEALCLLLTAYDMPINDKGIERMRSNPLIRDFLEMTIEMEGRQPEKP